MSEKNTNKQSATTMCAPTISVGDIVTMLNADNAELRALRRHLDKFRRRLEPNGDELAGVYNGLADATGYLMRAAIALHDAVDAIEDSDSLKDIFIYDL